MSDYCIENDFAAQKELAAQHEGRRAVSSNALFAENVSLRESLAELLALYDDFKEGEDQCFEDAYHSFYKGQYDKWEKARNLLANIKGEERSFAEFPPPLCYPADLGDKIPKNQTIHSIDFTINQNFIEGLVLHHQMKSRQDVNPDEILFVNKAILPENLQERVSFSHRPNKTAVQNAFRQFLQSPPQYMDTFRLQVFQNYYDLLCQ
jgi:hypothetical protein